MLENIEKGLIGSNTMTGMSLSQSIFALVYFF